MGLYYEVHVTVEPVFGAKLEQLRATCKEFGFKVADLLMQKRPEDTPERSQHDTFATGRFDTLDIASIRCDYLVKRLKKQGFRVWRYKIEDTLADVKTDQHPSRAPRHIPATPTKDVKLCMYCRHHQATPQGQRIPEGQVGLMCDLAPSMTLMHAREEYCRGEKWEGSRGR